MRKSLLKTRPSVLSSRLAPPPVALAAVGRRAAERTRSTPYTGVPVRVAVDNAGDGVDDDASLVARVRLLEGFVSRTEIADCAHFALQWLGETLGVSQSICLVRPGTEPSIFVVGSYGLRSGAVSSFSISL